MLANKILNNKHVCIATKCYVCCLKVCNIFRYFGNSIKRKIISKIENIWKIYMCRLANKKKIIWYELLSGNIKLFCIAFLDMKLEHGDSAMLALVNPNTYMSI